MLEDKASVVSPAVMLVASQGCKVADVMIIIGRAITTKTALVLGKRHRLILYLKSILA